MILLSDDSSLIPLSSNSIFLGEFLNLAIGMNFCRSDLVISCFSMSFQVFVIPHFSLNFHISVNLVFLVLVLLE